MDAEGRGRSAEWGPVAATVMLRGRDPDPRRSAAPVRTTALWSSSAAGTVDAAPQHDDRPPTTERRILQVSETAVSVLEEARTAQEIPGTFGVRIFANAGEDGQGSVALAFTEEPIAGDQVTEQSGTEIYVAPDLAEPLASSVLDVEHHPTGPQLTIVPQSSETS